MMASVVGWFRKCSTVLRLTFSILGLGLLSALALMMTRKRATTQDSRRISSQSESKAEVKVEEYKADHAKLAAESHIKEAQAQEALIPSIDSNLSAVRARIAALKKELGQ